MQRIVPLAHHLGRPAASAAAADGDTLLFVGCYTASTRAPANLSCYLLVG
jgi:hypothetical protein